MVIITSLVTNSLIEHDPPSYALIPSKLVLVSALAKFAPQVEAVAGQNDGDVTGAGARVFPVSWDQATFRKNAARSRWCGRAVRALR